MSSETVTAPIDEEGHGPRVPLEGQLGLKQAQQVHEVLCNAVANFDTIEIDASRLQSADISIIQLLVAAREGARRRGKAFSIKAEPEDPLSLILTDVGLGELVGPHALATHTEKAKTAQ